MDLQNVRRLGLALLIAAIIPHATHATASPSPTAPAPNPIRAESERKMGDLARELKNDSDAAGWYAKAAQDGDAQSQFLLGAMYTLGRGVPLDYKKAVELLTQAAEQSNVMAQATLALVYFNGEGGIPKDLGEAEKWARKSADQGNAVGETTLGNLYLKGTPTINVDYVEAANWFHKAAVQGNARAEGNLALAEMMSQFDMTPRMPNFHDFKNSQSLEEEEYFWFFLSAASGISQYAPMRDRLAAHLNPQRVAEIQEYARHWKPAKP